MSSATGTRGTFSTLLEVISQLNRAFSMHDFCQSLESVFSDVVGCKDITIVNAADDGGIVLHSPRVGDLQSRLRPPRIDLKVLEPLVEKSSADLFTPAFESTTIDIDGITVPLVNLWAMGSSAGQGGYILFHSTGCADNKELVNDITPELKRIASLEFFRLVDRERLQEELDLYQTKLHAITEVGELLGSLDLDRLLNKLMELSLFVVNGEIGSVILVREDEVTTQVEWGLPLDLARCFCDGSEKVVYEKVIETMDPVLVRDFKEESDVQIVGPPRSVAAYLCVPLITKGHCLGVINIVNADEESSSFSMLDQDILMTISGLAATAIENAILYADAMEKERYAQSLAIARDIQNRMYPSSAPDVPGLDIAWRSQSCDETGGDYFDFVPSNDGLTVAIGDVSGHGIGAALLMASARAGLRTVMATGESKPDVVLGQLNSQLERDTEIERFMTMFVVNVVPHERDLEFVNAGHDAPCVFRSASTEVEELMSTGMPLGMFDGVEYRIDNTGPLESGDALLLTTDGVWEVKSPEGVMLGKPELIEWFRDCARKPAKDIVDDLLGRVSEFTGGVPSHDDVTMVVLKCT